MEKLTHKTANELFKIDYNSINGFLIRNKNLRGSKYRAGEVVGSRNKKGYITTACCGKDYYAHRIVFLIHYGYMPENEVDHIDRVKHHNHPSNLRDVSRQCNSINTGLFSTNTSGITGVSFDKHKKKWHAYIAVDNKRTNIGYFSSKAEAACHRLAAEQCSRPTVCRLNSYAYNYVNSNIYSEVKNV